MTDRRQRHDEAFPCGGAGRQPEPQQVGIPVKAAGPDALFREFGMHAWVWRPHEPKQRRSANRDEAIAQQHTIQRCGFLGQSLPHGLGPIMVGKGNPGDGKRRAGDRPRAQCFAQAADQWLGTDGKAQAEAGKSVELPERAQCDSRQILERLCQRLFRRGIDERLVDNQPSRLSGHVLAKGDSIRHRQKPAVRIVGMDDNRMGNVLRDVLAGTKVLCLMPGLLPRFRMFGVGRGGNPHRLARSDEARQPLDQRLRSRRSHDVEIVRHAISLAGCSKNLIQRALPRQFTPDLRCQAAHGIGKRADTGRKVEPFVPPPAEPGHRLAKITAMLHAAGMAWKRWYRQPCLAIFTVLLMHPALAQTPPARIVSINMCTDQLLLDLARPEQIAGLSPFAADATRSWAAEAAKPFPRLSGSAEEVLVMRPDLVVGGRFTRHATREFIRGQGYRLEEFDAVRTIAETRAQILRMGVLVGNPGKAQQRVAEIDAALARLRALALPMRLRVLPVARRGWVSGAQSLLTDLLAQGGLVNVAGELGFQNGGFASLEAIVMLKPDAILMARDDLAAEDQGSAKLLHPALSGRYANERRLTMPERLTVCGGPMLVEAIDYLIREIERIGRRP